MKLTAIDCDSPNGWVDTTFGEISEYVTSGSRNWSKFYSDQGAMFVRTQDINTNQLQLGRVARVALPEKVEGKRTRIYRGDILITITGANVGKVALIEGDLEEAYVSQSVALVRLKEKGIGKFLHYQLMAKFDGEKTILESMAYGLGRPVLNLNNIRNVQVRLAPLEQQKRIVAEIEKQFSRLDKAVANLKRVKANLKRYKAAVLKAAVEGKLTEEWRKQHPDVEPANKLLERILEERRSKWEEAELAKMQAKGKVPKDAKWKGRYPEPAEPASTGYSEAPIDWQMVSLEQITSSERVICYGILMPKQHIPDGVPYVKVRDMRGDKINFPGLNRTSPEIAAKYERASLKEGDILLSIRGTYGRVAEVPEELEGGNITQDTARLDVLQPIEKDFISLQLRAPDSQNYFKRVARGVAVKGVNIGDVRPTPIYLPPLREQKAILDKALRALSFIDEIESETDVNLNRAARLRQSILKKAFSGRL